MLINRCKIIAGVDSRANGVHSRASLRQLIKVDLLAPNQYDDDV